MYYSPESGPAFNALYSADAERSVIGSMLIDSACIPAVCAAITPEDVYLTPNRDIFEAIYSMQAAGQTIDAVTVLNTLRATGKADDHTRDYLISLMELTPTAANVKEYVEIIKEDRDRRKLRRIADELYDGITSRKDARALSAEVSEALTALSAETGEKRVKSSVAALADWYIWHETCKRDPSKAYVRTGYEKLDEALGGGLSCGNFFVLAGRPGMGKTTVALNIAERIARRAPVLFFSLEMSTIQITAKRVARETGYNVSHVLTGRLSDDQLAKATEAMRRLSTSQLYVVDELEGGIPEIESIARSMPGLACIVIDQLSYITQTSDNLSVRDATTRASNAIRRLALKLGVPILLLCQLNRESAAGKSKRPNMAQLRESGAVEQDAGGVILLHREGYYSEAEQRPETETIELIVDKVRFGAPGTVSLRWDGRAGSLDDY